MPRGVHAKHGQEHTAQNADVTHVTRAYVLDRVLTYRINLGQRARRGSTQPCQLRLTAADTVNGSAPLADIPPIDTPWGRRVSGQGARGDRDRGTRTAGDVRPTRRQPTSGSSCRRDMHRTAFADMSARGTDEWDIDKSRGGRSLVTVTEDLSMTGLRLRTPAPLPAGTQLALEIDVAGEVADVAAEVMHARADEFGAHAGVRFAIIDPATPRGFCGSSRPRSGVDCPTCA